MTDQDDLDSDLSSFIMLEDTQALKRLLDSLENDIDLGPWLTLAAAAGKILSLKLLIDLGADVNYKNEDGETPFSYACAKNQFQAAKLLHRFGADINSIHNSGCTPLDLAVCRTPPKFRNWLKSIGGIRKRTYDEWPWPPPP